MHKSNTIYKQQIPTRPKKIIKNPFLWEESVCYDLATPSDGTHFTAEDPLLVK